MILRTCHICRAARFEGLFSVCATCRVLTWPGRRIPLGAISALVLERLAMARGYVSTAELIDYVYGEREDGGPLTADGCIHRAIWEIRRRMAGKIAPFRIENRKNIGYCIAQVATQPALTNVVQIRDHVGTARLSAGVFPIGRARGDARGPALFSGAPR